MIIITLFAHNGEEITKDSVVDPKLPLSTSSSVCQWAITHTFTPSSSSSHGEFVCVWLTVDCSLVNGCQFAVYIGGIIAAN